MLLNVTLGSLAVLSLLLMVWQWAAARRFPLHRRIRQASFAPGVSLLKPLKGCDETTEACLRSWFDQAYNGPVQILFGVACADDPVCAIVLRLIEEYPRSNARLMVCAPLTGANLKVSKLMLLAQAAEHEVWILSDADVKVPPDLLANLVAPLEEADTGLVNCFYELANPSTPAMHWEAVSINADFWSQVLQSQTLKPLDFALGAVMATRRRFVEAIGGFAGLADCLADDYQLGHRIARQGRRILLCPVTVQCWSSPMSFSQVWRHQLRWARTIRVCQPVPYFFSILSNPTLWPWLWLLLRPGWPSAVFALICTAIRMVTAHDLQRRLQRDHRSFSLAPFALLKDLLQAAVWLLAFLGNRIEWRGERMRLRPDGTLIRG